MSAKRDIPASAGLTAADNETLDVLSARMNVSHAEVLRRALHLLATAHGLTTNPEALRQLSAGGRMNVTHCANCGRVIEDHQYRMWAGGGDAWCIDCIYAPTSPFSHEVASRMRAQARAEAEAEWEREVESKAHGWA